MVTAQEKHAPGAAATTELCATAKRSSGQAKPLCIDGRPARQAVIGAPLLNVLSFEDAEPKNEVTTLPAMLLLSNTYNAVFSREFARSANSSAGTHSWAAPRWKSAFASPHVSI